MTNQTMRRIAPFAAAAAVLAVVLGIAVAAQLGDADRRGRDTANAGGSSAAPLQLDGTRDSAGAFTPNSGRYVLSGDLPDGPDAANVRSFVPPQRSAVVAFARALGLAPSRTRTTGSMLFVAREATLTVEETGAYRWFYSAKPQGCIEQSSPDGVTHDLLACPEPQTSSSQSNPVAPAPSAEEARRSSRPVFVAAGLDPDEAVVTPAGSGFVAVVVQPTIDGMPAAGLETAVTVGADGVVSAYGWLAETRSGASYPVISAKEALAQLTTMPQPLADRACPEPADDATADDACGRGDVAIVGARFGLSMQWGDNRPLLVPSWLFEVDGSSHPIAQVAVAPAYLAGPPSSPPPGGGSGSDPGAPTSTDVPPDEPGDPMEPAEPTKESRFTSVAVSEDGRTVTVTFYGGVPECNTYELLAKEAADAVYLTVAHSTPPNAGACIEIAELREASVSLAEPVGDRRLIDTVTHRRLPERAGAAG